MVQLTAFSWALDTTSIFMRKKSFGQRIIENITRFDEENTSLDEAHFSAVRTQELVFKYSIKKNLIGLLIGVILATILLLKGENGEFNFTNWFESHWFLSLIFCVITVSLIATSTIMLMNRKVQAKINSSGIQIKEFELPWNIVTVTKLRKISEDVTELIVQTETKEYYINLQHFDIKPNKVGHMIEVYKKQQSSV